MQWLPTKEEKKVIDIVLPWVQMNFETHQPYVVDEAPEEAKRLFDTWLKTARKHQLPN